MDLDDTGMDGYHALVLAVGHREFSGLAPRIQALVERGGVVYDVKGSEGLQTADARL